MKIGYIRAKGHLLKTEVEKHKAALQVERLFFDMPERTSELEELVDFARSGDIVVVPDLDVFESSAQFIRTALALYKKEVFITCLSSGTSTSNPSFRYVLKVLANMDNTVSPISPITTGHFLSPNHTNNTHFEDDLEECFVLVENRQMTVKETCEKLRIGKSTYYMFFRDYQSNHPSDTPTHAERMAARHPELFEEYEEKVQSGEMTVTEAAKQMGIGITSYYRLRNQKKEQEGM